MSDRPPSPGHGTTIPRTRAPPFSQTADATAEATKRVVDRWFQVSASMPSKLVDRLILLPCYAVPAPQCRMEGKVMDDYFTAHPE